MTNEPQNCNDICDGVFKTSACHFLITHLKGPGLQTMSHHRDVTKVSVRQALLHLLLPLFIELIKTRL